MPKTSHLPPIAREPNVHTQSDAFDHLCEWQRHVDAGRIGERSATDRKILARHARNELLLLGEYRFPIW
ncbi:MAG: hypothetical protein V2I43_23170 [Parvularcula sp.]|jgi:hypothetical protein|nr:hypothetical protein [Parvularcula sp.]